jgi:hypothetical protein
MKHVAQELRLLVDDASARLAAMNSADVAKPMGPEKWSKKQILGHLIDSAANNHQRFVRACYGAATAFQPYSQNDWVRIQNYQEADWANMVALWSAYNRHLSHLIERIPPESLPAPCNIGEAEPATLEFVITDYLRHLRHHLAQLQPTRS